MWRGRSLFIDEEKEHIWLSFGVEEKLNTHIIQHGIYVIEWNPMLHHTDTNPYTHLCTYKYGLFHFRRFWPLGCSSSFLFFFRSFVSCAFFSERYCPVIVLHSSIWLVYMMLFNFLFLCLPSAINIESFQWANKHTHVYMIMQIFIYVAINLYRCRWRHCATMPSFHHTIFCLRVATWVVVRFSVFVQCLSLQFNGK